MYKNVRTDLRMYTVCWCNISARCVSGDFHFLYRSSSVMDSF
uniref:Uncharacterized protein n=1 Tax=Anguilla anguilla TaxID=7936 RepID=A0A0E9TTV8_ANGAN